MRDYALEYGASGIPVIPLHNIETDGSCSCIGTTGENPKCRTSPKDRGKHPRIGAWQNVTLPDLKQIEQWWTTWPNANIGAVCGTVFDVLDVDGAIGKQRLAEMIEENEPLPEGPVVRTGSGGTHLFFKPFVPDNVGNKVNKFAEHIDLRGRRSQVVLPPSSNGNGRYEIVNPFTLPIPEAPDFVKRGVAALAKTAAREARERVEPIERAKITPNLDRHDATIRFAWKARQSQPNLRFNELFALTWAWINNPDTYVDPDQLRSNPPDRADVEKAVTSALDKPVGEKAAKGDPEPATPPPASGIKRWQVAALARHSFPPNRWHVDGWLPQNAFVTVIAPRKAGKSTITLQMALCVATGTDFMGSLVEQAPVLFIEEEGADVNLQERVVAQTAALGITLTDSTPLFILNRQHVRLDDNEWVEELRKQVAETGAKVVFIGPLAHVVALESENDNAGMQKLTRRVARIVSDLQITLVLTHHARKPDVKNPPQGVDQYVDTARGAGALMDAVDSAIVLKRHLGDTNGRVYLMHRAAPEATYPIRYANDVQETLTFEIDPVAVNADGGETDPLSRVVIEKLRTVGGWISINKAAAFAKASDKTVKGRLERLEVEGLVEHRRGAKNAVEWRALTEDELLQKSGWLNPAGAAE